MDALERQEVVEVTVEPRLSQFQLGQAKRDHVAVHLALGFVEPSQVHHPRDQLRRPTDSVECRSCMRRSKMGAVFLSVGVRIHDSKHLKGDVGPLGCFGPSSSAEPGRSEMLSSPQVENDGASDELSPRPLARGQHRQKRIQREVSDLFEALKSLRATENR